MKGGGQNFANKFAGKLVKYDLSVMKEKFEELEGIEVK